MTMIFPGTGGGLGNVLPFQGAVNAQQMSTFLDLEQADIIRLKRYAQHWRFYHTQHWQFERDDGAPLVTLNYAKVIVDKAVSWLVKNGVEFDYPDATEGTVKPLLEEVWKYNKRDIFLYDLGTTLAVTGDGFILVTFAEPTELAMRRNPNSRGQIKIDLLGSEQCFPTWDPLDASIMTSCRIETIFYDHNTRMRPVEDDAHPRQGQGSITVRRFTQIITVDTIIEMYEGGMPSMRVNTLGEIPVVHIKNLPVPRDFYGLSDLDPIMTVQQELNEKVTDESDIIHYHAGPTTVVTGAKAANIEKSPNKIWSGLPADAKVTNLEMSTDLGATQAYIAFIRKSLLEISETPEILLEQPNISNTSGVAMHMMYQPIVDKTKRRLPAFQGGLEEINYLILRIAQTLGFIRLPFDLCSKCGGRIVEVVDKNKKFKRTCYQINSDDYSWKEPDDVEVLHIRQHSFGYEVREDKMSQVRQEHMMIGASHWDPATPETQQAVEDRRLAEGDKVQTAEQQHMFASTPAPAPTAEGVPANPAVPRPPSVRTPTTQAEAPKLQGELEVPAEPEAVNLSTIDIDPITGAASGVTRETRLLVPTGCIAPEYLDPYSVPAKMKDALPRDDAIDLGQYVILHERKVVSADWIRRKRRDIDPDDYDDIKRELQEEERDKARPEGVVPEDQTDAEIREQALGKAKPGVGPESSELARAAMPGGNNQKNPGLDRAG